MRALLVSTYDLGRQPFGLASPAAWLRAAGVKVECVDTSRVPLEDHQIAAATVIAFYLPMHTATRLAGPLIDRTRRVNPAARLCAYGLYAPLNAAWLGERGVTEVLGPEAEAELVDLVKAQSPKPKAQSLPRLRFIRPDRAGLPTLERYASLRMPDGSRRIMGSTDATRGCKHLCRHCPIVPVYQGRFRVVPLDVVMEDIRAQVAAGAQHISFGDPDFLNGPAHARHLVERVNCEFPDISYDVTIKIEHLLDHADMIPVLRDTGCLFITSAVEAIDDFVLDRLRKGHTRADFVSVAALCRKAAVTLVPTFVPFTPWTTLAGYVELLDLLKELDLVEQVAPIQLAIRLLVTSGSPLLDLPDVREAVSPFDPASLTWPWRHHDARIDALQAAVMQLVGGASETARWEVFSAISALARAHASLPPGRDRATRRAPVPYVSEPWYCCAEPMENL
ncbi:MAG: radical SAM protein [Acidobacteria bacterium]|nr:radical SAM protein [Acidobacteriota bacterium]